MKLYHGNCFEVMKDIPDGSIDLILCDLPYGVTANPKDVALPFDLLWNHYKRLTKPNGAILLFAQGLFFVDLVNSNRKMFRYDLVWDKVISTGFLNARRMPLRRHEQIAVFYKKLPQYNPQYFEGPPLHSRGVSFQKKELKNANYGRFTPGDDVRAGSTTKFPVSVLTFPKPHPSVSLHPTEKPVALLEWLIRTYSNVGDTVLDNCMGSGSTGIACLRTGREFIGIEIDDHYFDVAKNRIENFQFQKEVPHPIEKYA